MKIREPWDDEERAARERRLARLRTLLESDLDLELQDTLRQLLPVAEWLAQWPDADLAFQCGPYQPRKAAEQLDTVAKALGVWPKDKDMSQSNFT